MHVTSAMNLPGLKGPLSLSYISLTVLSGGAHMLPCKGITSPDVWLQSPSSYWCSHYCTVWKLFGNIGVRWNIGFMKSMRVKGKILYSSIKPSCLLDLWFLLYLLWSWFWLWSIWITCKSSAAAYWRPERTDAPSQLDTDSSMTELRGTEQWHVDFQKTRRFKLQTRWLEWTWKS